MSNYEVREHGRDGKQIGPQFDDVLHALDYAKSLAGRQCTRFWVWRTDDEKLIAECGTSLTLTNRSAALNLINGTRDPYRSIDRARELRAGREHCPVTGDLHDWHGTGAEYRCTACKAIGYMKSEHLVERRCQAMRWDPQRRRMKRCCNELAKHMHTTERGMCRQYAVCEAHRHGLYEKGAA